METPMTAELYWMTLTVLMTALFWLPYVLDRYALRGPWPALTDTKPEGGGPHSIWAQRAIRAHANAVENLAIFVPAVLTAHALNLSTPATRTAAAVYFFARLGHFLDYTAGIPVARTLTRAESTVTGAA
jgi:uncharacterized MAPEG superfamily protein